MQKSELERIVQIQKQFIIFVGDRVCTIAQAEASGLVEVRVDENSGNVAYRELAAASKHRGFFETTH